MVTVWRIENANTALFSEGHGLPDFRAAYALARSVVPRVDVRGHHIVVVQNGMFSVRLLPARADSYFVVGRHTQCNLHVDDPSVALRHLLVRSVGNALRVLDLHTSMGFLLPDGSRQSSILAEGPLALAIGRAVVIALPTYEAAPADLPVEGMSPYRMNAKNRVSRITLMPHLLMLGEGTPFGETTLTLSRDHKKASIAIADKDLFGGVLLGRSEKCHAETLRQITDGSTSRVHLLLLREGSEVSAYDLASTQGTFYRAAPVGRVRLPEAGITLSLGHPDGRGAVRVHWHRN